MSRELLCLSFVAALLAPAAAQQVAVVDGATGASTVYAGLMDAIAAAQNGDIVQIGPGTFVGGVVPAPAKALRILGAGVGATTITPPLQLTQPPAPFQTIVSQVKMLRAAGPPSSIVFGSVASDGLLVFSDVDLPDASFIGRVNAYRCVFRKRLSTAGPSVLSDCTIGTPDLGGDVSNIAATLHVMLGLTRAERCRISTYLGVAIWTFAAYPTEGVRVEPGAAFGAAGDGDPAASMISGAPASTWWNWTNGLYFPVPAGASIRALPGSTVYLYPGVPLSSPATGGGEVVLSATVLPTLHVTPWSAATDAVFDVKVPGNSGAGELYVIAVGMTSEATILGPPFDGVLDLGGFITFLDVGVLGANGAAAFTLSAAGYDPSFHFLPFYAQAAVFHAPSGLWGLGQSQSFMLTP